MKKTLITLFALILLLGTVEIAKADFILDPNPSGEKLYLVKADEVTSFTGIVGDQADGPVVSILTDGKVDTGDGWANIKPSNNSTLVSLAFTPASPLTKSDPFVPIWNDPWDAQLRSQQF